MIKQRQLLITNVEVNILGVHANWSQFFFNFIYYISLKDREANKQTGHLVVSDRRCPWTSRYFIIISYFIQNTL